MLECRAIGRLTKDPELKTIKIGNEDVSVCKFSIAADVSKNKTEFIECVAWRGLGETIAKYFTKGRMIWIAGSQSTRKYPITKKSASGEDVEFTAYSTEWNIDNFAFIDKASSGGEVPTADAASEDENPF